MSTRFPARIKNKLKSIYSGASEILNSQKVISKKLEVHKLFIILTSFQKFLLNSINIQSQPISGNKDSNGDIKQNNKRNNVSIDVKIPRLRLIDLHWKYFVF